MCCTCEQVWQSFKQKWHELEKKFGVCSRIKSMFINSSFFTAAIFTFSISTMGIFFLEKLPYELIMAIVSLLAIPLVLSINNIKLRKNRYGFTDSSIAGIVIGLIIHNILFAKNIIGLLSLFTGVLLLVCRLFFRAKVQPEKEFNNEVTSEIYHKIYNPNPIKKHDKDELGRDFLAKEIASHISSHPEKRITFGINGEWGSGKTSLINLIKNHIELISGSEVLIFESWHYREPDNIISILFERIKELLKKHCESAAKIDTAMHKLIKNSTLSVNGHFAGISSPLKAWFPLLDGNQRDELVKIMEDELNTPLIIFIDDLDRLDKEELDAIFRSIRLLSTLPKIKFILAYDKNAIKEILFSQNQLSSTEDYFNKIIQQEFQLPLLTLENRRKFLLDGLQYAKEILTPEERSQFDGFISGSDEFSEVVLNLLKTPREIRRILADTIWIYQIVKKDRGIKFYLNDLFVLTVIRYKKPLLYRQLQHHTERLNEELRIKFDGVGRKHTEFSELKKIIIDNVEIGSEKGSEVLIDYILWPLSKSEQPDLSTATKNCRIFSHYYFSSYFQYTTSEEIKKIQELEKMTMAYLKDISDDTK